MELLTHWQQAAFVLSGIDCNIILHLESYWKWIIWVMKNDEIYCFSALESGVNGAEMCLWTLLFMLGLHRIWFFQIRPGPDL